MTRSLRVLTTGVLAAIMALGSSSAAAAAKAKPKKKKPTPPNLVVKITAIKKLPGDPPYIVLDASARVPTFDVEVSVTNTGGEKSGKSVVELALQQKGRRIWVKDAFIRLHAHETETKTAEVHGLTADLGFVTPKATVRWAPAPHEERTHSFSAEPIPVVALDWNVSAFQTRLNVGGQGPSSLVSADGKLMYHFSTFDENSKQFVYDAIGKAHNQAGYSGGGCTGQGSADMTPASGAPNELRINGSLTAYSAEVITSGQPPITFNVQCQGGVGFPTQVPWQDLLTFTGSGEPKMSPEMTTLTDKGSKMTPVGELDFDWTFNARLSGA